MHWNPHRSQIKAVVGIVAIVVIGLVFGVTQILKSRKGSLTISLHQSAIRAGEKITGLVKISPRQDLNAQRITLVLVCHETWEEFRYDADGYKETRSESRERHSQTLTISETMRLVAGQQQEVMFEVQLPAYLPQRKVGPSRSTFGGSRSRGWERRSSRLRWKLTANMELEGLDIDATHHF
ncbi:MAG: sporulation protein [Planctomycetota bacterium]|nr:sporulation protein [Planctomycetota bacterium]